MRSPKSIIECNDLEAIKQFYTAGADVNAIYENGDTALIMACSYLSVDAVKLLLELGPTRL
jgi:ankyrin repeat protein